MHTTYVASMYILGGSEYWLCTIHFVVIVDETHFFKRTRIFSAAIEIDYAHSGQTNCQHSTADVGILWQVASAMRQDDGAIIL